MCGRYALTTTPAALSKLFGVLMKLQLTPRFNVAPTQMMPVVVNEAGEREIMLMRWGLIPSWAKDASIGSRLINARSETAAGKPAFRSAFKQRRCVVPASGFYEWMKTGGAKQPYFITRADGQSLGLAGLWENWTDPDSGKELRTFTILTTDANEALKPLHDRMPVILEPEDVGRWLGERKKKGSDAAELTDLLRPAADGVLALRPVSSRVNSPKNDDASVLDPVPGIESPKPSRRSRKTGKPASPGLFDS